MRWHKPNLKDKRSRRRFAWLPLVVDYEDREVRIWLESYMEISVYNEWYDGESVWEGWQVMKRRALTKHYE